jgi:hypothetical protein
MWCKINTSIRLIDSHLQSWSSFYSLCRINFPSHFDGACSTLAQGYWYWSSPPLNAMLAKKSLGGNEHHGRWNLLLQDTISLAMIFMLDH